MGFCWAGTTRLSSGAIYQAWRQSILATPLWDRAVRGNHDCALPFNGFSYATNYYERNNVLVNLPSSF